MKSLYNFYYYTPTLTFFITILSLISSHSLIFSTSSDYMLQKRYDNIKTLVYEFLDVTKNPHKSFKQYIEDLIVLIKDVPQTRSFCKQLEKIKNSKKWSISRPDFSPI